MVLAKGVDTAAHMAALQNGGRTIAVIGTGLDVFIPEPINVCRNTLAITIWYLASTDLVKSPLKFHFPARNRIIAGLCRSVIAARSSK